MTPACRPLTAVARESLEYLNRLLNTGSVTTIRSTIPIFATVYPMVFRFMYVVRYEDADSSATAGSAGYQLHGVFESSKARIISLVLDAGAQPHSAGVKAAAWKFVQKVLLVGTRAPSSDPRVSSSLISRADSSYERLLSTSAWRSSSLAPHSTRSSWSRRRLCSARSS